MKADLNQLSDAELMAIAGVSNQAPAQDLNSLSNEELMSIAGINSSNTLPFAEQQQKEYETAQQQSKIGAGAVQAVKDTPDYLAGYPIGLKNLGYGVAQGAASIIDPSFQSPISENLRKTVANRIEEQKNLPQPTQTGIKHGQIAPFLAIGGTSIPAIGVAGAAQEFTKPSAENLTLKERGTEAAIGGAESMAFASGLKLAKKGFEFAREAFSPLKEKAARRFSKLVMDEAKPLNEIISEAESKGLDVYDILDPRGSAKQFANESLITKRGLAIADKSLKEMEGRAEAMKEKVLNAVSKNELDSVQAANVIGANANKILEAQLETRRLKAKPLYEKSFAEAKRVDPNSPVLKVPAVQNAINQARKDVAEFGEDAIAGNIKDLPDNDRRVLHLAQQYLYKKSKDFTDLNTAEYGKVRNDLLDILKKEPNYAKAVNEYAEDSKAVKELLNSENGRLAKLYKDQKTDTLVKQSQDIFKLQPKNIIQLKNSNPEGFQDALRATLKNKMESVNIEKEGDIKNLKKTLFGNNDKGIALKAGLNDEQAYQGLRDTIEIMGKVAERADFTKSGQITKKGILNRLPIGKFAFISEGAQGGYDFVFKNPKIADEYANLVLTAEGREALKKIAKAQGINQKIEKINQMIIKAASLPETEIMEK